MQNQLKTGESQWNILKLLKWTTSYFKSHNIDNPRAAAEILLAHALKLERIDLYLRYDQPLCGHELSLFKTLIKRRVNREPVAYIVGVKEFWSMDLVVTNDVLIPRPETECMVEAALSVLSGDSNAAPKRILELGTGSGAVILALASQRPKDHFFASDCSIKAVELAKQNARRHNLNVSINFFSGDWFKPLGDIPPFDMIISNPPYIRTGVVGKLQPEIYRYEPCMALDGGEDGLSCLRYIIGEAHNYLQKQGSLFLEIGHDQKNALEKIANASGHYEDIVFTKDYSGHDRVVQMKKSRAESSK